MKNSKSGNSIAPWTLFIFYMALFYMQYKGREKAAKVVEFVAKWLNLCLLKVLLRGTALPWWILLLEPIRIALVNRKCFHVWLGDDWVVIVRIPFTIFKSTLRRGFTVYRRWSSTKKRSVLWQTFQCATCVLSIANLSFVLNMLFLTFQGRFLSTAHRELGKQVSR